MLHARVGSNAGVCLPLGHCWGNRSMSLGRDYPVYKKAVIPCSCALKDIGRV